jgi:hypothetical protein
LKKQKAAWRIAHAGKDPEAALAIAREFVKEGGKRPSLAGRINLALGTLLAALGTGSAVLKDGNFAAHGAELNELYGKSVELREVLGKEAGHEERAAELANEVRGSYLKASRGIGALGLVGDGYALAEDWDAAKDEPLVLGKLAGDLITAVGDAMTLIPGLEPLGEAISIVGSAIAMLVGAFIGDPVANQRRTATRQTLVDGRLLDAQQASAATQVDSAGNMHYASTLTGNAALSPVQLQTLLKTHDRLFKDAAMIETAHGLWTYYSVKAVAVPQLLSPFRDSFFMFLNVGDPAKMELPLLYARPSVRGGEFDASTAERYLPDITVGLRAAFPASAFAD